MYKTARIAIEGAAYGFDRAYAYFVPENLTAAAAAGRRVRVPFGGSNRSRTGIILDTASVPEREEGLKPILEVLDEAPILNAEGLALLRYLKEASFCTWFDALRLLVPAGMGVRSSPAYRLADGVQPHARSFFEGEIIRFLKGKKKLVKEKALCGALGILPGDTNLAALVTRGDVIREELLSRRTQDEKDVMARLNADYPAGALTKKQREVMAFLEENGDVSLRELCYFCAVTRSVPDRLKTAGIIEYFDVARPRDPYGDAEGYEGGSVRLSPEQEKALAELVSALEAPEKKPALLYGVTGSGKTEVYLELIQIVLDRGRRVIIMVPEISLTAQAVRMLLARFGKRVAVLHSGLSLGERLDQWRGIKAGNADIVIGTRSAVFAPLDNIGLIVMDEEQEHTYHSERSPRYHARDIAKRRCAYHGAMLMLASATPSVESYYQAVNGAYGLVSLGERYGNAALPDVYTVDMSVAENLSDAHAFSSLLRDELARNLENGEQSILLLNRRGYSTLVRCPSCGEVEGCPHCSVTMTYHSANSGLMCHYCGFTKKKPDRCPACGGEMIRYSGYGTQRLEEELCVIFPGARVLRVDMDTTMPRFSHEKLFNAFSAGEYDIMIGTQMVAKGLNFPNVTLVGVLAADQSLYAADFRSFERSFALLTQVTGRSGRGEKRGRAVIQTWSPDNPVIALAANQDYTGFYEQEIKSRKYHLYPPFCAMAGICFSGAEQSEVMKWSGLFLEKFREAAVNYPGLPLRVLGPADADPPKAAGKYRRKLVVKCRNDKKTRELLAGLADWFCAGCKTVGIAIDMYYDRM